MGKRDYRHRESKKPKKESKKAPKVSVLPSVVRVEVVKKEGKEKEPEE